MKAIIIIEDAPTADRPGDVHIEVDFDPPLTDESTSNAQRLAAEILGKISQICRGE